LQRWTHWPLDHPRVAVSLVVAATLLLGLPLVRGLRVDNRISVWLPAHDHDLAVYERFRAIFGEDAFLLVAVHAPAVSREPVRGAIVALENLLEAAPFVQRVRGPFTESSAAREDDPLTARDGSMAAILVYPREGGDALPPAEFVDRVKARAAASQLAGRLVFAGPTAINAALDRGSRRSFAHLFPVAVLLIVVVLWLALRRIRYVLATLLVSGVAIVWTLGLHVLAGGTLDMVVSVLPSLLVVLGTAYSLHLSMAHLATGGRRGSARWTAAIDETWRPCLLTALTTVAGLGALAWARIPPVRHLGILSAFGVMAEFFLVFFFLPPLHRLWHGGEEVVAVRAWDGGGRLVGWIARHRNRVLGVGGAIVLVAAFGLPRLRIESHILSFFPRGAPVVQATHEVETHLFGLTPIEIWTHGPASLLLDARALARARSLERDCAAEPAVTAVFSPLGSGRPAAGHGDRFRVADGAFDARTTLAVRTISIERSEALVRRLRRRVGEGLSPGVTTRVTGAIPILVRIQALLLRTQIGTFAISMALITALLAMAFRSLRWALLSLVPNVLPIVVTLGAMGYAGIPLDVATVTVASIALGLVVDDTIHIVGRLVATRSSGRSRASRLEEILRGVGRPILFTSIATAVGFSAFLFAPFRPTFFFGLLVGFTALVAVVCDVVLLPALVLVREP